MTVNFSVSPSTLTRPAATKFAEADAKKLTRYVKGETIKDAAPDTFSGNMKSNVGAAAVFEGIPLLKFLKNSKKCPKAAAEIASKTDVLMEATKKALKDIPKGTGKLTERIGNYFKSANELKNGYIEARSAAKAAAKAEKLAKAGKAAVTKEAEAVITNAGKEAAKKTAEVAGKAGKLGKLGKFMKSSGAGFMLVINGVMEAVTEVIPTFKELGAAKGMKQLGRSAIRAAGDALGWIAGEQIGVAAGAAIGTAICPVVGTAVGGAIGAIGGFIGGCAGSFVMGKVTKGLTGKTEREKAKEEEENKAAYEAANNNSSANALKEAAKFKIQQELSETGTLSEDAQEIAKILDSNPQQPQIIFERNPFTAFAG